jgi:flagellar biosynthesis chaperone FliJ
MSTKKPQYPLEDVLKVKIKRVEDAEKALNQRRIELVQEQERLKEREKERDAVLKHMNDKVKQLRDELDGGTTSPKVQMMKDYMKVVKEKLVLEEKKVKDQKDKVKAAEKKVEEAKNELLLKQKEVDKFKEHKSNWLQGAYKELEVLEARDHDELGNIIYTLHHRKGG